MRKGSSTVRKGFTLVEMSIGLVIVSIILGAIAGIMAAVGSAWRESEDAQSVLAGKRQISAQLYRMLRNSSWVLLATSDQASPSRGGVVVYWVDADNSGTIQAGELCAVEHGLKDNTLTLYQLKSGASNASAGYLKTDMQTYDQFSDFKALPNMSSRIIGRRVATANFTLHAGGRSPLVEFAMTFDGWSRQQIEYGTAALRGPSMPVY